MALYPNSGDASGINFGTVDEQQVMLDARPLVAWAERIVGREIILE
jgi:hypothetical protein